MTQYGFRGYHYLVGSEEKAYAKEKKHISNIFQSVSYKTKSTPA
jgi:hypothetical protein